MEIEKLEKEIEKLKTEFYKQVSKVSRLEEKFKECNHILDENQVGILSDSKLIKCLREVFK